MNDTASTTTGNAAMSAKDDGSRTWHREAVMPEGVGGAVTNYRTEAGFVNLFDRDRAVAEVFFTAWIAAPDDKQRPITFVFNGGPGASSAFLHTGALAPKRVAFGPSGEILPPPARLVDNRETWLGFTDLVFIDPVGTGWSRALERVADTAPGAGAGGGFHGFDGVQKAADNGPTSEAAYWTVKKDLNALCEVIRRLLSRFGRWSSPVVIAGESYGGFRVARLVKQLQEDAGVGLNGAILISPALEFSMLYGSDYNVFPWIDVFPTMALASYRHGLVGKGSDFESHRAAAEAFAAEKMPVHFGSQPQGEARTAFLDEVARLGGMPRQVLERHSGRINMMTYAREVLRDSGRIVGLYDGSMTVGDPFPDRPPMSGPDPSLAGITRVFTGAIQTLLTDELKIPLQRDYMLFNLDAFSAWRNDEQQELQQGYLTATDQLKYGLFLNEHMQVMITHGYYDLVTPYFASKRLVGLMQLPEQVKARVMLTNHEGGHMFYSWEKSRKDFAVQAAEFYRRATSA